MNKKIGILLTNTGTPSAPTTKAVRQYLKEFLSDQHVIQLPRVLWYPILYGLILPIRPQRSARLYKKIWTEQGSPMRVYMHSLANLLEDQLNCPVVIGMNYGSPSIQEAIKTLQENHIEEMLVVPLFPQYSHTTTASSFERVKKALSLQNASPVQFIHHYAGEAKYIKAQAENIQKYWRYNGTPEHLLISFHGIPERYAKSGDPYPKQCEETALLLANALNWPKEKWTLCYQSRFGYNRWLKPSTQLLFETLPQEGVKQIDVVCPGFTIDCLETLEEIALRGHETFLEAGGKTLRYIPALNDTVEHAELLAALIQMKVNEPLSRIEQNSLGLQSTG